MYQICPKCKRLLSEGSEIDGVKLENLKACPYCGFKFEELRSSSTRVTPRVKNFVVIAIFTAIVAISGLAFLFATRSCPFGGGRVYQIDYVGYPSLGNMTKSVDLIIAGEVMKVGSTINDVLIFTKFEVKVLEVVKPASFSNDSVTVAQVGGYDSLRCPVMASGDPLMQVGERFVFFLCQGRDQKGSLLPFYHIDMGPQGRYSIRDGRVYAFDAGFKGVDGMPLEDFLKALRLNLEGVHPLLGESVTIGVISPSTDQLRTVQALMNLAEEDINNYSRGFLYPATFSFLVEDANGSDTTHIEKIQVFKSIGRNLVIGGAWDSQASLSKDYVNENNMLLLSPGSTSPLLSISGDSLFRLSPDDNQQALVISEMLRSWGVKAVIVIQRGDAWVDGIYNATKTAFESQGGVIAERIRYPAETMEFSSYMNEAEAKAKEAIQRYGKNHTAVVLLSFSEARDIVKEAKGYPTIYDLYWFGSNGTALIQSLINEVPEEANHLKVFSPRPAPTRSEKYTNINDRFHAITNETLDFYMANWYDAAWICAKAALEAETTNVMAMKKILSQVAGEYFGASGLCRLNAAGDRAEADYDIWGVGYVAGKPQYIKYGIYEGMTGKVTWYADKLGFNPLESQKPNSAKTIS